MCDPTMLAVASLGTQVVGTLGQSKAAAQEASDKRAAHEYNAQLGEYQAADALTRGAKEVVRHRMEVSQLKGKQRAALAANGVAVDSGSALDVLAGTDIMAEMDADIIMQNAEREAFGYRSGAAADRLYASQQNPSLARRTTLLTGAQSVASGWYNFKQSGAFG